MTAEPAVTQPAGQTAGLDIGALFDAQGAFVHRVAQRLTGSGAIADDVVQEVFLLAYRRRADLDVRVGIRTWLYRATVNVCRQRRRGNRRYDAAISGLGAAEPESAPRPDRSEERRRDGERIRATVATLSEAQREVFILYELEEVEGGEIAVILDLPINTVWSRLRLARAAFREAWTAQNGGEA